MSNQQYAQAGERFLAQAKQELSAGDLAQASEKGWGATAHIIKAIAERRGWEHNRHRHLHQIVSRLRTETGDREIRRLFDSASAMYENFYENDMPADEVAERLDDVETLLVLCI
jgi:HEPN domain-containing protein